ncbi:MAG: hypothetical protein AAF196_07895 [Planctomycetota bacterium]
MEPESPQSADLGPQTELRSAARAEVDALIRRGVLEGQGPGLRGARIALVVCAVLAAIGLALGSAGVPGLADEEAASREDPPRTSATAGNRNRRTDPLDFEPRVFARGSGLARLRDEAFEAIEDGDPARARRAAARFLLRPREATPGLRAERPDLWRILGESLRQEALQSGSSSDPLPEGGR